MTTSRTTTRPRRTMLSPPQPILMQLFVSMTTTCLMRPATIFCPPNEEDLSNTTTTNSYPVKKWETIHRKQTSHDYICSFATL